MKKVNDSDQICLLNVHQIVDDWVKYWRRGLVAWLTESKQQHSMTHERVSTINCLTVFLLILSYFYTLIS